MMVKTSIVRMRRWSLRVQICCPIPRCQPTVSNVACPIWSIWKLIRQYTLHVTRWRRKTYNGGAHEMIIPAQPPPVEVSQDAISFNITFCKDARTKGQDGHSQGDPVGIDGLVSMIRRIYHRRSSEIHGGEIRARLKRLGRVMPRAALDPGTRIRSPAESSGTWPLHARSGPGSYNELEVERCQALETSVQSSGQKL